ncbi:hypothetical protein ABEW05_008457 [Botrytis cinerea]
MSIEARSKYRVQKARRNRNNCDAVSQFAQICNAITAELPRKWAKSKEEQRTVVNANISMLEWCMLRLENDQKREERVDQLSLFESVSSQLWWIEDIDTDGEQESSHHKDEIPELKYTE